MMAVTARSKASILLIPRTKEHALLVSEIPLMGAARLRPHLLAIALSSVSILVYSVLWVYSTRGVSFAGLQGSESLQERRPRAARVGGYLIPVVRGGPNNQLGDIASAITVAAKLGRDVIIPPLQEHKSAPGRFLRSQSLTDVWNISRLNEENSRYNVRVYSLATMLPELKTLDMAFVGCVTKRLDWKIRVGPQREHEETVPVSISHWGDLEAKRVQCFDDDIGVQEGNRDGSDGVAEAFTEKGLTAFPVIMVAWGHLRHQDRKREVVDLLRSVRFTNDILVAVDRYLTQFGLASSGESARPYVGVHARRGDFEEYCNNPKFHRGRILRGSHCLSAAGEPVALSTSTCFPSPQLIGTTVSDAVAEAGPPTCLTRARDVVVATNEMSGTPFWTELEQAILGGRNNLQKMHSFAEVNDTMTGESSTLSSLQQSVLEQAVMIRSCVFVGNIASSWSRMVMHYREAWRADGACRYVGQGLKLEN